MPSYAAAIISMWKFRPVNLSTKHNLGSADKVILIKIAAFFRLLRKARAHNADAIHGDNDCLRFAGVQRVPNVSGSVLSHFDYPFCALWRTCAAFESLTIGTTYLS